MTEINRYTYDVNELEDFCKLLDFWSEKEFFHPIFIEWQPVSFGASATYWFETEWYRASITIHRDTPEEVNAVLSKKILDKHELIECRACACDIRPEEY